MQGLSWAGLSGGTQVPGSQQTCTFFTRLAYGFLRDVPSSAWLHLLAVRPDCPARPGPPMINPARSKSSSAPTHPGCEMPVGFRVRARASASGLLCAAGPREPGRCLVVLVCWVSTHPALLPSCFPNPFLCPGWPSLLGILISSPQTCGKTQMRQAWESFLVLLSPAGHPEGRGG